MNHLVAAKLHVNPEYCRAQARSGGIHGFLLGALLAGAFWCIWIVGDDNAKGVEALELTLVSILMPFALAGAATMWNAWWLPKGAIYITLTCTLLDNTPWGVDVIEYGDPTSLTISTDCSGDNWLVATTESKNHRLCIPVQAYPDLSDALAEYVARRGDYTDLLSPWVEQTGVPRRVKQHVPFGTVFHAFGVAKKL